MNFDVEKIAKHIKKYRNEKKLTQSDLASDLNISRSAISKWERGKSIPDIDMLIKLKDIFCISLDELLLDEKKVSKENLTYTLLESYKAENDKNHILKRKFYISLILLIILILLFFSYYFITTFNTIKVYSINSDFGKISTQNGILVLTKDKMFLKLGEIETNNSIKKIELYFFNTKKNKKIIFIDSKPNILIKARNGYGEYFDYKNLKSIKENLYLKITFENNEENTLRLYLKEEFKNNRIISNKAKKISEEKIEVNNKETFQNIERTTNKIIEKGEKINDEGYTYIEIDNNKKYTFHFKSPVIDIIESDNTTEKIWTLFLTDDRHIIYRKIVNYQEESNMMINSKKITNSLEKDILNELNNLINTYLFMQCD